MLNLFQHLNISNKEILKPVQNDDKVIF